MHDCVVVGAGLAGLLAATRLRDAGLDVCVVEAEARPGGRMATRRSMTLDGPAVWDEGAQFFTVRDDRFARYVDTWRAAGLVRTWFEGLLPPDPPPGDEPHLHAVGGMDRIPDHLAHPLEIHYGQRVQAVRETDAGWTVGATGNRWAARSVILALPVPLGLELLAAGEVDPEGAGDLRDLDYLATLALYLRLDRPSGLPEPGGWHGDGNPISLVADNQMKGISHVPTLTVHAGREFSRAHLGAPPEAWAPPLLDAVRELTDADIGDHSAGTWPYASPAELHPEPTVVLDGPAPIALAGDAFDGPRVEGAGRSGLAAADAIASRLL
jgi:renalase